MQGISAALSTPSGTAFGAAILWGLMSVFLSPCHLGAIPLIVAYSNDGTLPDRRRSFVYSLLFGLGLLVTLAVIGVATSAAGRLLGDVGTLATSLVGGFLVLCGIWLMDIPALARFSPSVAVNPRARRGRLGALSLGLVYGIVLGPCSFAFLAPMLGFVFSAGRRELAFGTGLMACYALGHTTAIVLAGTFGDVVLGYLRTKGSGRAGLWLKRALGLGVAVVGVSRVL